MESDKQIIEAYKGFISQKNFSCIAAKAAVARQQIHCFVAEHMACPANDRAIVDFLYSFIKDYRQQESLYHSAAIIFRQPQAITEGQFEDYFWQRLQSLSTIDARQYRYDGRVNSNPHSPEFSFSIMEESFFIIGMHPSSVRKARQFPYPTLVFNPHAQFQHLKETGKYQHLKEAVRKREITFSGSINPMLKDFGESSEVYQYTGKQYSGDWKCPLNIIHERP